MRSTRAIDPRYAAPAPPLDRFGVVIDGRLVPTVFNESDSYGYAAMHRAEGREVTVIRLAAEPV